MDPVTLFLIPGVVAGPARADRAAGRLCKHHYDHFAMTLFMQHVSVLRSDKF